MSHNIPFFSLSRQWQNLKANIKPKIDEILESQQYIGMNTNKFVKEFEEKLAKYLKVKHVIACNSGTDALWLAIKALNLKENEIVLTTPFSFIASCSEIVAFKGNPVFIDVDPETYNISPKMLEDWLTKNATLKNNIATHNETGFPIKGIIAVNIFGQCADFEAINKIAKKWNLWTVEDCAQAIGSHINGKMAGSLGDISTLSFYPTKNLGAFGDAGAVCTNDDELAKRVSMLRNQGRESAYNYVEYGINSRLDGIQAAVLSAKLDFLGEFNNNRRKIAKQYNEQLKGIKQLHLPKEKTGFHTYHQFPIIIDNQLRTKLIEHLTKNNIGFNTFYPESLSNFRFLQTNDKLKTNCPITEELTKSILDLPIWPELTTDEINYVCDVIKDFFNKN